MGKLIHVRGDLFTSDATVLAHGCNCLGSYGSGVAGIMAKLYPEAKAAYLHKHNTDRWTLGEVQFVEIHPDRVIANMATQYTYGRGGVHVNYDAIEDCFRTLFEFCQAGHYTVAIPKIGSGLAGGDWARIEGIIRDQLQHYKVEVTCYSLG